MAKKQLSEAASLLGKRSYQARLQRLGIERLRAIARENGKKGGRPILSRACTSRIVRDGLFRIRGSSHLRSLRAATPCNHARPKPPPTETT